MEGEMNLNESFTVICSECRNGLTIQEIKPNNNDDHSYFIFIKPCKECMAREWIKTYMEKEADDEG